MSAVRPLALLIGAAFALGSAPAHAQQPREVASKEIDVGRRTAALRLELSDGETLAVELTDGAVLVDGDEAGRYGAGGALDAAWRALLADAVRLDGAALAERLRAWSPPAGGAAAEAEAAARVDAALEEALAGAATVARAQDAPVGELRHPTLVELIEDRSERLLELARAAQELDLDDVRVHLDESVVIADGEEVEGGLVVVDGDLDVRGDVFGDVAVIGGILRLSDGGEVHGDARVVDGTVFRDGGEVRGDLDESLADFDGLGSVPEFQRERLRQELREEIRRDMRGGRPGFGRAIGELMQLLLTIVLLSVVGGGLAVHFGRDELEAVGQAARRNPVQAGMVGLAGAFLVVPAWVLGTIALVITIVGILAVPFWIVLFPAAVALAAGLGYLAVAQGVGEWIARQRWPKLEWIRVANPYATIIAGVGALMGGFLAARVLGLFGVLDFFAVLLFVLGVLATLAAALVGFGAVLITRGGRRPAYEGEAGYWGDDWDDDLGFGRAPPRPPSPPPGTPGAQGSAGGEEPGG